jgi:hypothetical protein
MNLSKFFEAASELSNWGLNLSSTIESSVREAEDLLCRDEEPLPGAIPRRAELLLLIRGIRQKIEEVMNAYDAVCEAAYDRPPFELALALLEASPAVYSQVRLLLSGLRPPPMSEGEESEGEGL